MTHFYHPPFSPLPYHLFPPLNLRGRKGDLRHSAIGQSRQDQTMEKSKGDLCKYLIAPSNKIAIIMKSYQQSESKS